MLKLRTLGNRIVVYKNGLKVADIEDGCVSFTTNPLTEKEKYELENVGRNFMYEYLQLKEHENGTI